MIRTLPGPSPSDDPFKILTAACRVSLKTLFIDCGMYQVIDMHFNLTAVWEITYRSQGLGGSQNDPFRIDALRVDLPLISQPCTVSTASR